jgi:transcription initiation factor TFIIB
MEAAGQTSVADKGFCQHCLGELLWDQENSERVCTNCGAVSQHEADVFEQVAAAGAPSGRSATSIMAEDIGVSTTIGFKDIDAAGRQLGQSRDLKQLRRLNTMVSWDSSRRRLGRVSMEVQKVVRALGLNSALGERAFKIYLKQFNAKSIKARSLAAVAAACVCMACREMDVARPPNELVARRVDVNEKKFRHYYRLLLSNEESRSVPSPVNYISVVAAKASLHGTTERMAIEILNKVRGDPRLVGKRPISLAAAALYLASVRNGDRTTQLRLAYAAGVTPITIRKRSLEISDMLGGGETAKVPQ